MHAHAHTCVHASTPAAAPVPATPICAASGASQVTAATLGVPIGHIGVCLTTLSSALSYLLGAPRVLQAVARDSEWPRFRRLASGDGSADSPAALACTWLVAQVALAARRPAPRPRRTSPRAPPRHPLAPAPTASPYHPTRPSPPTRARACARSSSFSPAPPSHSFSLLLTPSQLLLLTGTVNLMAPLVTGMFLLAFCMINLLAFLSCLSRPPSDAPVRHGFHLASRWTALAGFLLSFLTMATTLAASPIVSVLLLSLLLALLVWHRVALIALISSQRAPEGSLATAAAAASTTAAAATIEERVERAAAYVHDALTGRFRGVHWAVEGTRRILAQRILRSLRYVRGVNLTVRPLRHAARSELGTSSARARHDLGTSSARSRHDLGMSSARARHELGTRRPPTLAAGLRPPSDHPPPSDPPLRRQSWPQVYLALALVEKPSWCYSHRRFPPEMCGDPSAVMRSGIPHLPIVASQAIEGLCIAVFACEMGLKAYCMSARTFFYSPWHVLQMLLLVVSATIVVIQVDGPQTPRASPDSRDLARPRVTSHGLA